MQFEDDRRKNLMRMVFREATGKHHPLYVAHGKMLETAGHTLLLMHRDYDTWLAAFTKLAEECAVNTTPSDASRRGNLKTGLKADPTCRGIAHGKRVNARE